MTSETIANTGQGRVRDRVPVLTKILYGLGTALDMWGLWLYTAVAFAVFNLYLGVDPGLVGFALMIIRIYDAIVDPLCGWLSDNLRSKHGRRRPFILIAGILSGLGLPCLFLVSPSWVNINFLGVSVVFWYMLGSQLLYIPIVSAFTVPYNSLGAEMTPDYEERTSVMSYRSLMQKLSEFGNFCALPFTNLAWFIIPGTGDKNTLLGLQVYTSILGAVMAIFAITIFLRVKERYYEKVVTKTIHQKTDFSSIIGLLNTKPMLIASIISFVLGFVFFILSFASHGQKWVGVILLVGGLIGILYAAYKEVLKCIPFLKMMLMGGSFILGTSMVGALGYYATVFYVCGGDKRAGDGWMFWMGLAFMLGGIIGVPLMANLAHKIGKRHAAVVACCIGIIGYGGSWFLYTPAIQWLQTISSGLMGMASAALWMLHSSIGADIIDYDELNTGQRREGSFTACASYILKLGNSVGYFISGLLLSWSGFSWAIQVQSARTIFWIRAMLAFIPVAGLLFAIYFVLSVSITKQKSAEIRRQLEERRGAV